MTRGLYFAFTFLIVGFSYAQQSCSQKLNRAEDLYTDGRLLDIPGLISNCLENPDEFTEAERIRAHKLLTKVYIFTDNEAASESELIKLLHADPVHEIQDEDPSELCVLMAKFRTWPVYRLELRLGGNTNIQNVKQDFSVYSSDATEKEYANLFGIGLQAELDITRYLSKGIEVGAGIQFRKSSYNLNSAADGQGFVFITDITNNQTMLRLPVFARYNRNYDSREGLIPYGFLGFSLDYLLKANYTDAKRNSGTSFTLDTKNANLIDFEQVNRLNYSIFGGIGAKFRMKKGNFMFAEARFDKSLKLYNIPEERYSNPAIVGDLLFVEDDLFLNFLSFNVGYIYSVFKPEKLIK